MEHPRLLKDNTALRNMALFRLKGVQTHLPLEIGDYTDLFAGINHASNISTLFRGLVVKNENS